MFTFALNRGSIVSPDVSCVWCNGTCHTGDVSLPQTGELTVPVLLSKSIHPSWSNLNLSTDTYTSV